VRNLFLFLNRFHFFILFLLLEGICTYFLVQNNNYQHASFMNSSNVLVGRFYKSYGDIKEYMNLRSENKRLSDENARLRTMLGDTTLLSKSDKELVRDSIYHQQYNFISAKIINNSTNRRNNYITLDKGKLDGVERDDGVVASNGVIGKVKYVSDHFCVVVSLLHKDTRISAMIKKNKYFGSLVWDGGSPTKAALNDIPVHVPVAIGDTIVTSNLSPIYPEGILLGTIAHFELNPGQNFYNITINLSTSFSNITYVYIVNNILKEEQVKLEGMIPPHD